MRSPLRPPLFLGNWKMHMTVPSARALVADILARLPALTGREVALAPPFTALDAVGRLLENTPVRLAAQNLFWEDEGPYTGEISGPMLRDLGARYVLLGHSERRLYLGEGDRMVSHKVRAALRSDLLPLICVGEDLEARAAGRQEQIVGDQLRLSLQDVPPDKAGRLTIAYEPVWAIGTGRSATPGDAADMHAYIRDQLRLMFDAAEVERVRILYGGSVTERNIEALMARGEMDGVLVGGAALRAAEFARIAAAGIAPV